MIYRIIILSGASKGERITIEKRAMYIGRDKTCDIIFPDDEEIAHKHATIEHVADNNELIIRDMGSMNKVLVNNHEVREAKLKHGDLVEIGRSRFLVNAVVQAEIGNGQFEQAEKKPDNRKKTAVIVVIVMILIFAVFTVTSRRSSKTASNKIFPKTSTTTTIPPEILKDLPATQDVHSVVTPDIVNAAVSNEINNARKDITELKEPPKPVTSGKTNPPPGVYEINNKNQASKPEVVIKPPPKKNHETPLPDISITGVDTKKMPDSDEFDEQRILNVDLQLVETINNFSSDKVEVKARFFDQNNVTKEIIASPSGDPGKPTLPRWDKEGSKVSATIFYTIPRGVRSTGDGSSYYGYTVKVFYAGKLITQTAQPKSLLEDSGN